MVLGGTPEDIKGQYDQLVAALLPQLPPPSDAVESKDGEVDGIKYRLYTPKEASKQGPLPVGIWTHGGGWMTGDLNSDDLLCRVVAEHVPSIIVNVDYRLTPEHKIPTQLQDTLTVYRWVRTLPLAECPTPFLTTFRLTKMRALSVEIQISSIPSVALPVVRWPCRLPINLSRTHQSAVRSKALPPSSPAPSTLTMCQPSTSPFTRRMKKTRRMFRLLTKIR